MIWIIFAVLVLLWILGIIATTPLGGFIHILLIAAIVVAIIQILRSKKP
ncbi:MAG: lmo0937 family membrane protein [Ignavibacteria bacterium]|nr:lmo0937 family membrane protein [Ignavibacteria bacterium]